MLSLPLLLSFLVLIDFVSISDLNFILFPNRNSKSSGSQRTQLNGNRRSNNAGVVIAATLREEKKQKAKKRNNEQHGYEEIGNEIYDRAIGIDIHPDGEKRDERHTRGDKDLETKPVVIFSVIIVTYNQPIKLDKLLRSIEVQRYCPPFEVIVVDNGCMRDTQYIVNRYDRRTKLKVDKAKLETDRDTVGKRMNPTKIASPLLFKYVSSCTNIGYSQGNNVGAQVASSTSQWLLFLNDDVELYSYFFHYLVTKTLQYYSSASQGEESVGSEGNERNKNKNRNDIINIYDNKYSSVGAVGAKLLQPNSYYPPQAKQAQQDSSSKETNTSEEESEKSTSTAISTKEKISEAGNIIWKDGTGHCYGRDILNLHSNQTTYLRPVDYLSGAALLVNKGVFDQYGGFQGDTFHAYYEDTDLCFYLRYVRNLQVLYQPLAIATHQEHSSFTTQSSLLLMQESRQKFLSKWGNYIDSWKGANTFDPKSIFNSRINTYNSFLLHQYQRSRYYNNNNNDNNNNGNKNDNYRDQGTGQNQHHKHKPSKEKRFPSSKNTVKTQIPITVVLFVHDEDTDGRSEMIERKEEEEEETINEITNSLLRLVCYLKQNFIFQLTLILPNFLLNYRINEVHFWRQSGIEVLSEKEGSIFLKENFFSLLVDIPFSSKGKEEGKMEMEMEIKLESGKKQGEPHKYIAPSKIIQFSLNLLYLLQDQDQDEDHLNLHLRFSKDLSKLKDDIIQKFSMLDERTYFLSSSLPFSHGHTGTKYSNSNSVGNQIRDIYPSPSSSSYDKSYYHLLHNNLFFQQCQLIAKQDQKKERKKEDATATSTTYSSPPLVSFYTPNKVNSFNESTSLACRKRKVIFLTFVIDIDADTDTDTDTDIDTDTDTDTDTNIDAYTDTTKDIAIDIDIDGDIGRLEEKGEGEAEWSFIQQKQKWFRTYVGEVIELVHELLNKKEHGLGMKIHFNLGTTEWPLLSPLLLTNIPQIFHSKSRQEDQNRGRKRNRYRIRDTGRGRGTDREWPQLLGSDCFQNPRININEKQMEKIGNDGEEQQEQQQHNPREEYLDTFSSLVVDPSLPISYFNNQERLDLILFCSQEEEDEEEKERKRERGREEENNIRNQKKKEKKKPIDIGVQDSLSSLSDKIRRTFFTGQSPPTHSTPNVITEQAVLLVDFFLTSAETKGKEKKEKAKAKEKGKSFFLSRLEKEIQYRYSIILDTFWEEEDVAFEFRTIQIRLSTPNLSASQLSSEVIRESEEDKGKRVVQT